MVIGTTEVIWNLKRLIRDGFPQGLPVGQLELEYRKYFLCPSSFPRPEEVEPGYFNWAQVIQKSAKFGQWFRLNKTKKLIHVLPKAEGDLRAYFRLACYTQYLMAREGAKADGWADLSESGSDSGEELMADLELEAVAEDLSTEEMEMENGEEENTAGSTNSSNEDEVEDPEPSSPHRLKEAEDLPSSETDEDSIDPRYAPSPWLSEVRPTKWRYFPQIGDDLVYFWQGHDLYVQAVQAKTLYPTSKRMLATLPWIRADQLPAQIPVRVMGVEFEIKPPRLVTLRVRPTVWKTGNLIGPEMCVVYHDVVGVVDFLVLRQVYDQALRHKWNPGDKYRCICEPGIWSYGTIRSCKPFNTAFQDSKFLCYKVSKNSSRVSPWEIEPIPEDSDISKYEKRGIYSIPLSEEDQRTAFYQPKATDWPHAPRGNHEAECDRILALLEEVMKLPSSIQFLRPVDLVEYPEYTYEIAYPMDLNTIKRRLQNRFYRRAAALECDINYIVKNAEQFNKPMTMIVASARVIRDLCLKICRQAEFMDVAVHYQILWANFKWGEEELQTMETAESKHDQD